MNPGNVGNVFGKSHDDKPITKIEVSPNEKYLVTYSNDSCSIVGWTVAALTTFTPAPTPTNIKDEDSLKFEFSLHFEDRVNQMCVSDNRKLAYIDDNNGCLRIYDMNNRQKIEKHEIERYKIELDCDPKLSDSYIGYTYCTFNLEGDLILYYDYNYNKVIFIYSTQIENNKWKCKKKYEIHKDFEDFTLINISKYNTCYLFSNNSIYEWNIITEKSIKILFIDEYLKYNDKLELIENVRISSNENLTFLKIKYKEIKDEEIKNEEIKSKIIIYSSELGIPIASINNVFQLCELMKRPVLCSLLFPLLSNITSCGFLNSIMENCWKRYFNQNDQLPKKESFPNDIRVTNNYAFGILDGEIWVIYLEKMISNINSNSDELNNDNSDESMNSNLVEIFDRLHIDLPNPYMGTIDELFKKEFSPGYIYDSDDKLTKWRIINDNPGEIKLQVRENNNVICTRVDKFKMDCKGLHKFELLRDNNDNDIIILAKYGLLIYHFNENDKSISLNYFYKMSLINRERLPHYHTKVFSKSTLPLPNYESFECNDEWVLDVKNNKEYLLKYGVELLSFAIKKYKLELINEIYKKCLSYFKEDYNNKMFLSIIVSTMPLLNEYYPDYILRYSLDTTMIMDSPSYSIEYQNYNLHLFSFQYPQMVTWFNYKLLMDKKKGAPTIIFMNPYIKFVNYPKDYDWLSDFLKPQPSPFVETINRDIYKTWSGESLINFKWDKYGKYYYAIIWIVFMVFLGCFTAAATVPHIDDNVRKPLLTTSIILGIIHLSFEIRKMICNFKKWFQNPWNIFDVIAYMFPIVTSSLWFLKIEMNTIIPLFSFSCLFLDIKFLLFFRALKYFGRYFAIIISVAKHIFSFLVVLFIIIISFAHAFYILLIPRSQFSFDEPTNNDDPNNPWNLTSTYNQVFKNGTIDPNPYMIQTPDENTNMFINFKTAIFATYLFLTGDPSALSNWKYTNDLPLAILIVLFSLLIVVYLMNLFIGLLNNAIEKNDDRVSYLVQKAEILAEIELFYLSPSQRRCNTWFPEIIYYYANVDKTRKKIKEMTDNGEWNTNEFSKLKKNLFEKIQYSTYYQ